MEMQMVRKVLVALVGMGSAGALPGCYPEPCWQSFTCDDPVIAATPSCDPIKGSIDESRCPGVFVSSSLGSDDNQGMRDQPLGTLSAAINAARLGPSRVYACAETFNEAVVIPSGIEVWGGLDCAGSWAYVGESPKTMIVAAPNEIPLRFVAGTGRAVVADVHAEAAHATIPSGSSIAVIIEPHTAVDILRSEAVAGHGAHGLDGDPGGALPAPAGEPGAPGGAACTTTTVQGGAGAVNSCRGYDSIGGTGGIGGALAGGDGSDGTPAPSPNLDGDGLGGPGQTGASLCDVGAPGESGAPGANGLGGRQGWGISKLGLPSYPGQDGADGRPGQGGGGGGGSRAGSAVCGSAMGGASGGGGGAGGCGGAGGKGGGAGGASIGILSLSGEVRILGTSIRTGRGGDGGNGGLGQSGGLGGVGGLGGIRVGLSQDGCAGGPGGYGGSGGNGGGGVGGPSIGLLFPFGISPLHDADIRTDEAGKGGLGGDPNVPGSAGEDGVRADAMGVPP